ncbi:HflK protein [Acidithiobacillus marinus]|uniref:Protein HflK n=1 Tax=Acidithiobacillus marinus TaxID=187490 RepID=A0A2I1DJA4_9PROT|nr:FtsH protease activity modulator HflK [Acidithiobacillus marinus]PKY09958.1 HflK protein [Acidithiobacillus marinus]
MPWSDPGGNGNNNNNPWGRRPNEQKPAFDIQKITQELKKLGGSLLGSGKGRGSGGPKFDPRWLHRLPIIIIAILVLFWLGSGIYVVGPNEEGVLLRFGREVDITQPGIHYHWPFPFETVMLTKTAENHRLVLGYSGAVDTLNPGMMLTANGDVIDVHFAVNYKINNPSHYLFSSSNPEQLIRHSALSAMRDLVGNSTMKHLLHGVQDNMGQQIQQNTQNLLNTFHAGVTIRSVQIISIHIPKAVESANTKVMTAQEDMARIRREAEAYASSIIPKAKGEAATMLTAAQAYKMQVIDHAKGDAARFNELLQAYQKNPEVVSERMYLHTMQEILGNAPKVIMDSHGKAVINLHMPDSSIVQPSATTKSGAAVSATTAATRSTAPVATTDSASSQPILPVSGDQS